MRAASPDRLRWALHLAAVLAIALSIQSPSILWEGSSIAPSLPALVRAMGDRRFVEPRLTGGFPYASCSQFSKTGLIPEPQCSPEAGIPQSQMLRHVALGIQKAAERRPSPQTLHAAGVARVVWGRTLSSLDKAVSEFERAAAGDVHNASILNDLAAADYIRAQRLEDPYELLRALSVADRALAAAPLLKEARFNRALILQALFADAAARAAWLDYLQLDPHSGWSGEAEAHLFALNLPPSRWDEQRLLLETAVLGNDAKRVRQIVDQFRQPAREYAEQELLGAWAEASSTGRVAEATRALTIARGIGLALAAGDGDRMIKETVASIDAASRRDPASLQVLVEGHRAFQKGYMHYDRLETQRALDSLTVAREALARARSPFAAEAAFYLACAQFNLDRFADAVRSLEQLRRELDNHPYPSLPSLRAHLEWMTGVTHWVRGDPMRSIESYEIALGLLDRVGEAEDLAVVHGLLAASLEQLGRSRESWQNCYRALAAARQFHNPRHKFVASSQAADFNLRRGEPATALAFQADAIQHALKIGPALLADAHFWRGLMLDRIGRRGLALVELGKAERCVQRNGDELARMRNQADLFLVKGDLFAESNPRRAVQLLSIALDLYSKVDHQIYALLGHQARARAYRNLQEYDSAEADLRAALAAYQRLGGRVSRQETLLAFFAKSSDLFDQMISFQANERRRYDRAFEYADRARTQVLPAFASALDLSPAERRKLLAAEPEPKALMHLSRDLPESTVLVQYSVLEDRLLVWVVRRSGMQAFQKKISRKKLKERVMSFRRVGRDGLETGPADPLLLSDLLLAPWLRSLRQEETIVIVPDKTLVEVPFSCLVDRVSKKYLIELYPVETAPSATLYVEAVARRRASKSSYAGPHGLIIGDPAFAAQRFGSNLARLPGAEREAREVCDYFPGTRLLLGDSATREEFLMHVRQYRWVHYAGHAIVNDQNPLLSMLALAPRPGTDDSGAVYAWEIYRLDLRGTALVVLSGCGTGDSSVQESEGSTSLARAFLAAGASAVVASLWDVDDRATRRLFLAFYASLRDGASPTDALRKAQLTFVKSPDAADRRPAIWGAFEILGGGPH